MDGTLFGSAKKNKAKAKSRSDGSAGLGKKSSIGDFYSGGGSAPVGRRTMTLVTKNEVRNIMIKRPQAGPGSASISYSRLQRIRANAVPLAENADAQALLQRTAQRDSRYEASEKRKAEFAAIDAGKGESAPTDLDIEAQQREEHVLSKARAMLEDNEDEVKQLASTILQAQCQAVRDAQLAEKEQIKQAMKEEELRLDEIMEEDRVRAIEAQEKKEIDVKIKYREGRKELEQQIEERRLQRLLEDELREQESQELLQQIEDMKLEDEKARAAKAQKVAKMMEEVSAANALALELQAAREAEAKAEEARLAQFIADKVAAEEAAEARKAEEKAAKDREFRKLLAQQERAMDTQGKRDELAARRAAEEKERMQRQKEAREAEERRANAIALNEARKAQIEIMQKQRALQAMAEKDDFVRTLQAQEELIKTQQVADAAAVTRRTQNRDAVLEQIREKEEALISERKAFFAEGVKIDQEAKARRARLEAIKQRKLDELVASGLEGDYLNTVKRQINKSPIKSFS